MAGDGAVVDALGDELAAADRVVAFARESEGSADADHAAVVVALNFGDAPATVALDRPVGDIDLVTGESVRTDDGLHVDDVTVVPVTADR